MRRPGASTPPSTSWPADERLALGLLVGLALGALGGGGSILAVPALVCVVGPSPQAATTTSLVVVSVVSAGGLFDHWRSCRMRPLLGVLVGLAGVAASVIGSHLNAAADPDVVLAAFAALMLVAAVLMLRRSTGGLGHLLAQQLLGRGETVIDVPATLPPAPGRCRASPAARLMSMTPAPWRSPPPTTAACSA